jgi:two-component system, NarL family, response regulator DesR
MSRISVQLADDNRPIRDLIAAALTERFRVFPPVADGRALVEAVLRRRPDVIVSDVNMPVLDGIAAMQVLKALGCPAPFVMVSAERGARRECLEAGAAEFVCKEDVGWDLVRAVSRASASKLMPRLPRVPRLEPPAPRRMRATSSSAAGTATRR